MLFIKQKSNSCFFMFLFQIKIYKQYRKTTYVISFLILEKRAITYCTILKKQRQKQRETSLEH